MSPAGGETERRLQVDGREVRLLERGGGPPVVLVHGLGLSAGVWRPLMERLAGGGYRAIAPDLPGFGHSTGGWTGLSVPRAARWLRSLADTLGLEHAAWVGHSVGAQQVTRLSVIAPGLTAVLVLAAPTGRPGGTAVGQVIGLLRTAFRERPALVASVVRRYFLGPTATVGTWMRTLPHDMALDAPRVGCPVLLVRGARDPVVPGGFLDRLEQLIPDARAREIPRAAHAVAFDPVPPFAAELLEFLDLRYRAGSRTDRWESSGMDRRSQGSSER